MQKRSMPFAHIHKRNMIDALPCEVYTSEQVRELDKRIIDAGTKGIVLMRRAATAVIDEILRRWPQGKRLLVFCGKGNNGGDGYLVARLAIDKGWQADVIELAEAKSLSGDALLAREALLSTGVKPIAFASTGIANANITELSDIHGVSDTADAADVIIVDALLGTGIRGAIRQEYADVIRCINNLQQPVMAVDVPSGICSDTGLVKGVEAVVADVTVSFIGLKRGLLTAEAVDHVGDLVFDTLQADPAIVQTVKTTTTRSDFNALVNAIPSRRNSAYKNLSGHLLIIGGDYGMAGAPLLTASAALRCGAGLVSVATRPEHVAAIVGRQPEIMAAGIEKTTDVITMLQRATAVVIGPGLGSGPWSQQLLAHLNSYLAERESALPLCIDADALNLIASKPELLNVHEAVLTPHTGEAKRLLQGIPLSDQSEQWLVSDIPSASKGKENNKVDRFAAALALQKYFQSTIVLKGAGTLIAQQNQTKICAYGNATLATAGSGDVLSGVIGAYLAQGLSCDLAAEWGVCLHATAADLRAEEQGMLGMTSGDLPNWLVKTLNVSVADKQA